MPDTRDPITEISESSSEPMPRRDNVMLALVAASFANLHFLPVWAEFAGADSARAFFLPEPSAVDFAAALTAYLILCLAGFVVMKMFGPPRTPAAKRLVAVLLCLSLVNPVTLNGLPFFDRVYYLPMRDFLSEPWVLAASAAVLIGLAGMVAVRPDAVLTTFRRGLLLLAPFSVIAIANSGWALVSWPPAASAVAAEPAAKAAPAPQRVIWIIFDELDQRAVFEAPPKGFKFPALSRLYGEAFVATGIKHVNTDTITAVPGMTAGRMVAAGRARGAATLLISETGDAGEARDWRQTEHLFAAAARRGMKSAVVGWYFPYCRLFPKLLTECRRISMGTTRVANDTGFARAVIARLGAVNPFYRRFNAVSSYALALRNAKALAGDTRLDLTLIHVPIPHQPPVWDAGGKTFTALNFSRNAYFDNVAAADAFLGELRQSMEQVGQWQSTAVIVSSDHGWRDAPNGPGARHDRIPLLIKLAGPPRPVTYDGVHRATFMRDLILAIAGRRIATGDDLAKWLGARGGER